MKKNVMLKLVCSLAVSAIVIGSGIIMPFIPEEPIDPPCVIRPNDEFLPDKFDR